MRLASLTACIAALTACGPDYDLENTWVYDLRSEAPHFCAPPSEAPAHALHAVDLGPVALEGTVFTNGETGRGERVDQAGIEVSLWELASDTLQPISVVSTGTTDAQGSFTVDWDPGAHQGGLGLQIEDGAMQTLSPSVIPPSGWDGDITCAWWADADGNSIQWAPQGDSVFLVVEGIGALDPPSLVIIEVGNDLSGDDRVPGPEGEPFIEGMSVTEWVVSAEGGIFEGNSLELEFSAIAHPTNAPDGGEAVYGRSTGLGTNL